MNKSSALNRYQGFMEFLKYIKERVEYNIDRNKALHNIQYTCPKIHTLCSNLYGGGEAKMFIQGSSEIIYSKEGATQGCPAAGAFFSTGTGKQLEPEEDIMKAGYADDRDTLGKLRKLDPWWKQN